MRVCAKSSTGAVRARAGGRALALVALGALALAEPIAADGLTITGVQVRLGAQRLLLSGNIDVGLTPKVEEALNNGIPLEFVLEVRLHRRRALIWDETARSWTARRELRYHALSGQYLVTRSGTQAQTRASFQSLAEALAATGVLDESLALDPPLPDTDGDYRVGVRVHLDIEALPPVLRPAAYTSRAWDLNSGWTMWKAQP